MKILQIFLLILGIGFLEIFIVFAAGLIIALSIVFTVKFYHMDE
jgi:hypothetical protein